MLNDRLGFKLNSESVEEVEIKSTISGGVRNTFSERQVDRSHEMIYISVDAEDLKKHAEEEMKFLSEILPNIYNSNIFQV